MCWTSNLSEARVPPDLNPSGLNDTPATVTLASASGWDVCMQNLRSKHTQALFKPLRSASSLLLLEQAKQPKET